MEEKVISTKKMDVIINEEDVIKIFKKHFGYKKRYKQEKRALELLSSIDGIPKILSFSDEIPSLTISRLNGNHVKQLSDKALLDLKNKLNLVINLGVARHSLPIRDILVDEQTHVGIVDFERVTLKEKSWKLTWYMATQVTKFHVCNFIYKQNKDLLTENELAFVNSGLFCRKVFKKYIMVRNVIRIFFRKTFKLVPN